MTPIGGGHRGGDDRGRDHHSRDRYEHASPSGDALPEQARERDEMDARAELAERPRLVELALADEPMPLDEEATQEEERARPAADRLRADRDEDLRELTHPCVG